MDFVLGVVYRKWRGKEIKSGKLQKITAKDTEISRFLHFGSPVAREVSGRAKV